MIRFLFEKHIRDNLNSNFEIEVIKEDTNHYFAVLSSEKFFNPPVLIMDKSTHAITDETDLSQIDIAKTKTIYSRKQHEKELDEFVKKELEEKRELYDRLAD